MLSSLPSKPRPEFSHGSKGFSKGHIRERAVAAHQVSWKEACATADANIEALRTANREARRSTLNWFDKLFLSRDQMRRRQKAIKATAK